MAKWQIALETRKLAIICWRCSVGATDCFDFIQEIVKILGLPVKSQKRVVIQKCLIMLLTVAVSDHWFRGWQFTTDVVHASGLGRKAWVHATCLEDHCCETSFVLFGID